MAGDLLMASIQ